MKRLLFASLLLLSACGGHAGAYLITPAAPAALSPSAAPVFYLVPFQDRRREGAIYRGRSPYENVVIEAEGLSQTPQAWRTRPYGSVALLWHRQLAQALTGSDTPGLAAEEPVADEAEALRRAGERGAKYLLSGSLERLEIGKKGADEFLATNFSGTNYPMALRAHVRVLEVASGRTALDKRWDYERTFYDPTRLGNSDRNTFPGFFIVGLQDAAQRLGGWQDLRALAGLPPLTPTPTPTPTPLAERPTAGPTPTPAPTAVPTPDEGPHWENPKTGKRVDPSWNFDPEDGTPRKDFVLRQPTPKPTPVRPTSPR